MSALRLTDLIDVSVLQEIQDGFSDVTGMAALTVDADGAPVTKGSNFTDFCMKYTRGTPEGCRRCERCDKDGSKYTGRTGRSLTYSCHAGLTDFSAPIIVNGEMLGSFVGGQVLTGAPDMEKIRRTASELSINEDEYIEALGKIKTVPASQVEKSAKFLHTIAKNISSIAYANYMLKRQGVAHAVSSAGTDAAGAGDIVTNNVNAARNVLDKFSELVDISEKCVAEVKSTNETVKIIKDIAMNTRILGFNASIEASKAKESGKGFGVIAQEVRSLADTSKSSADKIESKMKVIGSYARQIEESAREARKLAESGIVQMDKLQDHFK